MIGLGEQVKDELWKLIHLNKDIDSILLNELLETISLVTGNSDQKMKIRYYLKRIWYEITWYYWELWYWFVEGRKSENGN